MTRHVGRVRNVVRVVAAAFASVVALLALAALLAPASVAAAQPDAPTSVSLRSPKTAVIGSEVNVTASVRRGDGQSPAGMRLAFYLGSTFLGSGHADAKGDVGFRVRPVYTEKAGTFRLDARFEGQHGLRPSKASGDLELRPARITIQTVPAVPDMTITLGDQKGTTKADGTVTIAVDRIGALTLDPQIESSEASPIRVSFIRWGDAVFEPKRPIDVRGDATYTLGLRTAYRSSIRFVDLSGAPVDPSLVNRVVFTSSTGAEVVLTSYESTWWEAGTAVSRTGGLQPSDTLWRLAEVDMAGTNVVNQGQQDFNATIDGTWTIQLLLYDLSVTTEDALTGGALGGNVELVYADGTSHSQPIASDGTAKFGSLPRGTYNIKVHTSGFTPPTPVALSRSQSASVRVISYLDVGIGGAVLVLGLATLLFIRFRRQPAPAVPSGGARVPAGGAGTSVTSTPAGGRSDTPSPEARPSGGLGAALVAARRVIPTRNAVAMSAETAAGSSGPQWPEPISPPANPATLPPPPTPVVTRPPSALPRTIRTADGRFAPRSSAGPSGARSAAPPAAADEPEPTHPCPHCQREVPDSARFCRMCGRPQP